MGRPRLQIGTHGNIRTEQLGPKRWRARCRYRDFDGKKWNAHSARLPYLLAQAHPDLVEVMDEYAFFFPVYDDPSGARLWRDRLPPKEMLRSLVKDVRSAVRRADPTRPKRHVPLLDHLLWSRERYYRQLRQSYCIHLWERLWWDAYLQRLGPETLGSSEGLFPRLVGDVLGGEAGRPAALRGAPEPAFEPAPVRRAAGT